MKYKLGELIEVKHGWAFKSEYFTANGEFLLLTPGNFHESGGLKLRDGKEKFYSGKFPKEFLLNKGDLLIVMTDLVQAAPILGGSALVPEENRFLHNQRLGKVIIKNQELINVKFLYYLLNYQDYREQIKGSASGATVRHTAPERIYRCVVDIPHIIIQKKIASILSSFDDLIENNLKRIKLLEEAAELIYREWFVNLRFPGHEKVKIIDGVPEGWSKSKVGLILKPLPISNKVTTDKYLEEGILPVIDQSTKYIAGYINDFSLKVPVEPPVIVFGDHTRIVKYIDFDFVRGADGTQLMVSNSNRLPQVLFYHHLKNINLSNYHYSRHFKFLKEESIFIPDKKIALNFEDIASPLYKQMNKLRRTNLVLSKARDLLLPKLMDGSLDLNKLEYKS